MGSVVATGTDTNTGLVTGADVRLYTIGTTAVSTGSETHIKRLDTTTNTVDDFQVPKVNAGSDGITVGPDGFIWFTEPDALRIGRLETHVYSSTGQFVEFPVPAAPAGIVTGPDGNLWFTEPTAGKIARFNPR